MEWEMMIATSGLGEGVLEAVEEEAAVEGDGEGSMAGGGDGVKFVGAQARQDVVGVARLGVYGGHQLGLCIRMHPRWTHLAAMLPCHQQDHQSHQGHQGQRANGADSRAAPLPMLVLLDVIRHLGAVILHPSLQLCFFFRGLLRIVCALDVGAQHAEERHDSKLHRPT